MTSPSPVEGVNKFRVLYDILRPKLKKLRPGKKFLSENEACVEYNVSRQTVRRAFDMLEREGLLKAVKGSGTYRT